MNPKALLCTGVNRQNLQSRLFEESGKQTLNVLYPAYPSVSYEQM